MDQSGTVWGSIENILYRTDFFDLEHLFDAQNEVGVLPEKLQILRSVRDRQGNYWMSSNGYGIIKLRKAIEGIKSHFKNTSSWATFQDVYGRLFSRDHHKVFVQENGRERRIWKQYRQYNGPIAETQDSTLWHICSKIDVNRKQYIYIKRINRDLTVAKTYRINKEEGGAPFLKMITNHADKLIIAGVDNSLLSFDPKTEEFTSFNLNENLEKFKLTYLYEGVNHDLWLCHEAGMLRAKPFKGRYKFKSYFTRPENMLGLTSKVITSVADWPTDPEKFLLIGTRGGGMAILNKETDELQIKTTEDGLPSNSILGIIPVTADSIWLSTFQGVSSYSFKTKKSHTYNTKDGLVCDEFNTGVFHKGQNGELIFGGVGGVSVIDVSKLTAEPAANQTKIVNLRINNKLIKPYDGSNILPVAIEYLPDLQLDHDQNNVSFEFSEMNFINTKNSSLQYRLKGVNEKWIDAGQNRTASFALLPPGDYTFELKPVMAKLTPSTMLNFSIVSPWYASWYAMLFYFLVATLIIYLISKYRRNQYVLKQELVFNTNEKNRLIELDQMKTTFLTNVSHELKTPLTLISGPAASLKEKYPKDDLTNLLNDNVGRLKDLVLQLLDIQSLKLGQLKMTIEQFDVSAFTRVLSTSFNSFAESKGITLQYIDNKHSFIGFGDTDKLNKILTNLVSNAIKFTSPGGQVRIESHFSDKEKTISFKVTDNGRGISEEDLPFIFDRFYQVSNNKQQGSGIGLALVKELVSLLKGTIEVESKVGVGSTFHVKLPLERDNWDQSSIQESVQAKPQAISKEKPLLLIVEDNADMQNYLSILLKSEYNLIQAKNGTKGISLAKDTIPDIILTDLMMPEMDGFAFSDKIKNTFESSHVPIVMLTAKNTKDTKLKSYDIDVDYFLSKPFDNDDLKGVLRNVLRNRKKLQEAFSKSVISNKLVDEPKPDPFLVKFRIFLQEHYADSKLDIKSMASNFHVSEKQFSRKIKNLSGLTPREFLRKYRLQKAAEMIKIGDVSISEVVFKVGYENLSHFSKSFTKEYGVSPSKYV